MEAKRLSSDRISTLPTAIIETILCLLPLQEAGRTSILSREWRYNWTGIPKLVFDDRRIKLSAYKNELSIPDQTVDIPTREVQMIKRVEFLNAVYQVLLSHHGLIDEFTLVTNKIEADEDYEVEADEEIDQIIVHLLRHTAVKKLDLGYSYVIPVFVFSSHQLTHLSLTGCIIYRQPTFNGYGSLTSLSLQYVHISKKALMHIISNNPLLKSFGLVLDGGYLKIDDDSTVTELFKCLPLVEDLTIGDLECFAGGAVPRVLPTSLIHLKRLCLTLTYFTVDNDLPFLVLLIRSSPNLEKLKIENLDLIAEMESERTWKDYSGIRLAHLVELEITDFNNMKPEMEFVKLILAKSPVLKKVKISLSKNVYIREDAKILKILLRSPRASPLVKIVVD